MRNKCVKCLGPLSEGEFVVNKDMAYCDDCAAILHLGESKESKMFRDFQDPDGGAPDGGAPGAEPPHIPDLAGVALEEGTSLETGGPLET